MISYSEALKNVDLLVRSYNEKQLKLSDQIRQPVCGTLKEVIRLFIKSRESGRSLMINNVYLSRVTHSSGRTIQRHLQKLQQAGLLSKISHGPYKNYEITISPSLLASATSSSLRTKCPKRDVKNNLLIGPADVDKSKNLREEDVHYAKKLWTKAKAELYPDKYLTYRQQKMGERMLIQWFAPVEVENLEAVFKVYLERIKLVSRYIARDPSRRFVQLPNRYFDPRNPSGFAGTRSWHEKWKQRKKAVRQKKVVHDLVVRFQKLRDKHDPLKLFRQCEAYLLQWQSKSMLDEFYKLMAGMSP